MKKLLTLCLLGMTVAVMALEVPIEITSKKDVLFWGSKNYYEDVKTSVEDGAAKVLVEKTVPGAKPIPYQVGIRSRLPLKAGYYKLTFTMTSNQGATVRYHVQQTEKPYRTIGGTLSETELVADEYKKIVLKFFVSEDIEEQIRLPAVMVVLKEGQTLELSDVKLTDEEAAVSSETPIGFKTRKDLFIWGSKTYYETVNVSVKDSVVSVDVEKTVPDEKPLAYQICVLNDRPFKAGVNYRLTFTLKSNQDASVKYFVRMKKQPYTNISGTYAVSDLTANEARTLVLRFSVKEDVVGVLTCLPAVVVTLQEGQTMELSDVKLFEEKISE